MWMYVRTHSTCSALRVYFDGVNVCDIALHIACTTCRRHAMIISKQHSTHLDHRQENGHIMYKIFAFVRMFRSLAHGISHECPARCPTHARCTILSIPLNMQCMCNPSPPARRERHVCTTLLQQGGADSTGQRAARNFLHAAPRSLMEHRIAPGWVTCVRLVAPACDQCVGRSFPHPHEHTRVCS